MLSVFLSIIKLSYEVLSVPEVFSFRFEGKLACISPPRGVREGRVG